MLFLRGENTKAKADGCGALVGRESQEQTAPCGRKRIAISLLRKHRRVPKKQRA